ncbi:MAG: D-alanyl-D-alanine carboxypeptidase [Clostridiales bacterium]|nr:D-alanyl-D-alanine carboxypeptidase [Clostridiales bacterium]
MKKTLSYIFTAFVLVFALISPFSAEAATYTPDREIYAEAYMLINLDDSSYPVVAEKNADEKLYPASLTKIVTAMVTINNVTDLSATTTMSQTAYDSLLGTGAQVAGIDVGEEITIDKLLYLAMVYSACDACQVLAEYVSGSIDAFVEEMNKWVQSIGCENTNFVNTEGLHDDNHYTTARDMSIITLKALENSDFVRYSTATEVEYDGYTLTHTNLMLNSGYVTYYYEYAQGIKTGSTDEGKYCVITKASKDGYNYLTIVMKSPQQKIKNQSYLTKCSFVDAKSLFEWAFDSLKYTILVSEDEVVSEIAVENGKNADSVQLVATEDINVIVPSGLDKSAIIFDIPEKPESVSAPVTKGDVICTANIIYGDEIIATVELTAAENIELSTFLKMINAVKSFFSLTVVKVVLIVIVIAVLIYLYSLYRSLKKKQKNRARKRARQQKHNDDDNRSSNSGRRKSNEDLPSPRRR